MPKPSELKEGQWIKIAANTDHKGFTIEQTGAIGFHVEYSQLSCFAINHDQPADHAGLGLEITNDPATADAIYEQWRGKETVIITHG